MYERPRMNVKVEPRSTFTLRGVAVYTWPLFEPLPGVLGNTGTVAFIFREQGIFSNYFQGTGELLTRLLGSFLGTRGFSNGEQGIKSKKVKGSWEHAPPPGRGSYFTYACINLRDSPRVTFATPTYESAPAFCPLF